MLIGLLQLLPRPRPPRGVRCLPPPPNPLRALHPPRPVWSPPAPVSDAPPPAPQLKAPPGLGPPKLNPNPPRPLPPPPPPPPRGRGRSPRHPRVPMPTPSRNSTSLACPSSVVRRRRRPPTARLRIPPRPAPAPAHCKCKRGKRWSGRQEERVSCLTWPGDQVQKSEQQRREPSPTTSGQATAARQTLFGPLPVKPSLLSIFRIPVYQTMAAVVEADAGQAAERGKATDEEGKTPPQLAGPAVRKQRQPTPDHPPYCWMIAEAIDALCERGGSEEDSISAFIRARYPGVPPAHDRFLRHYLDKHVAEGFFVRTAAGQYLRSSEENMVGDRSVVTKPKRGRGRPRKDGSSLTSSARKEDGAPSAMPKRSWQRPAMARLAADEGSVPASPVAVAEKEDGSQAAPWCRIVARLAVAKDSVPASLDAVPGKDGNQAASSMPKRRGRPRKLGMATATTDNSSELPVTTKKDGSEVPYTTDKEHEPPRELALVSIGDDSATTSIMDKACSDAPPTTPREGGQPVELAAVTTTDVPVTAPPMDKVSNTINRALVVKNDSICTMSTAPESSSQACDLALVVADDISGPVLVADNDGVEEAPSATYNRVRHTRGSASVAAKKAGSKALSGTPPAKVVSPGDSSARKPVAGKKAGRKVSFASPKLTPVNAVSCSTPASVADQDRMEARKLYPVTANEVPDDPAFCLLALPSLMPAATKG
ncbi:hypothetical protein HU200_003757 [Digitaria exilis]|uniref:H15 domain-containing protein n=1 Tax=Digitaria exilis TaxID=1010633 RepID=A0A835FXE1_9POAL|nr:hypothetical protein HU200_003757 [Digitaria exilis]